MSRLQKKEDLAARLTPSLVGTDDKRTPLPLSWHNHRHRNGSLESFYDYQPAHTLTPSLVGQKLSRFFRLSKAANKASFGIRIRIEDRRDGMPELLDFEALHGLVVTVILEATHTSHPNDTALYFRGHQAPCMAMASYK